MKVPFNIPTSTGKESLYISKALESKKLSGDGQFTKQCHRWFEKNFNCSKALLTTSCTHALELAALLADIKEGDEVIMPSFTFVSTANAFALRGAKIRFIDIRPDTMNIDESLIERAITEKTKVIVPVHYAGVACEMDEILDIAQRYNLLVIEDAAQGVMSSYQEKRLGTIGHLGCYSFHDTKNFSCGEGGALLINDERFIKKAEIIREKGTNRSSFLRGEVSKYTWIDIGSSYLPSELNAACLYAQLEEAESINADRLKSWQIYHERLQKLALKGHVQLSGYPDECQHNANSFYIKVKDFAERKSLIAFLLEKGIAASFHFIPLHTSKVGKKYAEFVGQDLYTTRESERLLRLPMYYALEEGKIQYVADAIEEFYF